MQSGALVAGERLPNEAALSERFGVTRLTLRHAITELQRLGAVEIRRGVGTFVVTPPDLVEVVSSIPSARQDQDATAEALGAHAPDRAIQSARSAHPLRQVDEIVVAVGPAEGASAAAAAVHLGAEAPELTRLDTVMMRGGRGWIANTYWYRSELGAIHELLGSNASVVHAINGSLGINLRYLWRAFSAIGADFDDAKHLGVPVGTALLVRDGVSADEDGEPTYYVRRRLRGDEARFVLRYDS